jgi:hypothetical protein
MGSDGSIMSYLQSIIGPTVSQAPQGLRLNGLWALYFPIIFI